MANMSYCRFENTARDLADCLSAAQNGEADPASLSTYEAEGLASILRSAKAILELHCGVELDLNLPEEDF